MTRAFLVAFGAALLFVALATLNAGGYQYGASDQAFYVPAVLHHLDPSLFPRDWPLLARQDRFNVSTAGIAAASRASGVSLPVLFIAGQLLTFSVLFWGLVALGRTLYGSWWTVAALVAAMTLRHRVAQTGVNTLESYMHPRMLAFAVGTAAVAAFVRGWSWVALLLAATAGLVHPTTGLWFCAWVGVAVLVSDRRARVPVATAALGLGGAMLAWLARGGALGALSTRLDGNWLSVLDSKAYLFPGLWQAWSWALVLAYPSLIGLVFVLRSRAGVAVARERGLAAGSLALFVVVVAALPLIASRNAFVVSLQVPRALWLLELLTTVYLFWWLVERPGRSRSQGALPVARFALVWAIVVLAAGRGAYVTFVEHSYRPVVSVGLPDDEWHDAMRWLSQTPVTTHVLAHPLHVWKFGTSVRVAAARDVFQEQVKDSALALYSRDTATRVLTRTSELGDFDQLTVDRARELAAKYDLDYLVAEQSLDLPVAYRNARFTIYALGPPSR